MNTAYQFVVCAGIVPDPLQVLEPVVGPTGFGLRNEGMLPAVLDTWASTGLYNAFALSSKYPGSRVYLVSMAPRAKLQQVMMTVAQKGLFELVPIDGQANGFTDSHEVGELLAEAIEGITELDKGRLFIFGGWESGSRGAGVTMQVVAERLGVRDVFLGVDELRIFEDGTIEIYERVEGGRHLISRCKSLPIVVGWATGNLPEPKNNPQLGMQNMRSIMPALQKARVASLKNSDLNVLEAKLPSQQRATRIVKDATPDQIAREIVDWILGK